jgi:hypothetical protein
MTDQSRYFNPSKNYWFSFNAFLGPAWLNELCNSSNPQSLRGVSPPCALYQGSVLDPLGDLKRSLDPSPTHAPPPNPKSWIRP